MTSKVRAVSLDVNLDDECIAEHPESLETWKVGHTVCFFFFQMNYWTQCLNLKVIHLTRSLKEKFIEHIL